MRVSRTAVAFVLPLAASVRGLNRRQNAEFISNSTGAIPGGYIGKDFARVAANAAIDVLKTFDSVVFNGASIQTDIYTLDTLLELPEVANVWPNHIIQLAPPVPQGFSDGATAAEYSSHNTTGVNKLHQMGIFGEGVVVGIVDTGTWYDHPALGGGFGPGFKVAKGHDFVGNEDYPNSGEQAPDDDPKDQQGHGTHVAGIIAGKTDTWSGVAPAATLYSYKVFSLAGSTDTATLIDAFLTAYNDGVDIITASIGGTSGWSTNAWAEVASRLVDEGVVVTIAAGNSGEAGPFFGSTGAAGENVVAVASVDSEDIAATPFNATFSLDGASNETTAGYLPATYFFSNKIVDWPIVPLNFNTSTTDDACTPYPAGTRRLDGVIPLVRRGTCTFATKQSNLYALGANYVLVYNNAATLISPYTDNVDNLLGMISAEAGAAIIATIKAGGNVTADFSVNPGSVVGLPNAFGGRPSTFTSWGALYDLKMKPDVAAPGGAIYSTWLNNKFTLLSGTSMACPYVAGVAALYISAHGGRKVHGNSFAKFLSKRLISSGASLPWSNGTDTVFGYTASVAQVGNGLINAFKVVNYTTTLEFEKFELNDTSQFSRYHDVTVTNTGSKAVTYTFSGEAAAGVEVLGVYSLPSGDDPRLKSFTELIPKSLEVDINFPKAFNLQPGESKTVTVNFQNPGSKGWNAAMLPIYSGKVLVLGSNGEQLSIPYLGLAADLKKEMAPIYRTTYPFSKSSVAFTDISQKSSYTFNLTKSAQDFPKIYSKIKWGTRQVRWDIFDKTWTERDWVYPPVVGQNGYIGPATSWVGAGQVTWIDLRYHDPNETWTYPATDVFRNAQTVASFHEYWWFGKLGNGSQIEVGNYTMRFATLKPFGEPERADNWSVFKTPLIEVLGKY
ncbi:subtilase [Rhexocercosporidium sp. MPI-PUGE-AT-0058]|nr:subtilase [Rhexocercosporidium sp. MPI-PUGE-AT-0058]